jgi:GcrA cell cycle regulator
MTWTEENTECLKALIARGFSAKAIADDLGVTRNAVIGKAHRLGLYGFSYTKILAPRKRRRSKDIRNPNGSPMQVSKGGNGFNFGIARIDSKAIQEFTDLPADESPDAVSLIDIESHQCRWPLNDPREPGFLFCGSGKIDGHSYCPRHFRLAHSPGTSMAPSLAYTSASYYDKRARGSAPGDDGIGKL